jgi:S1-C subfamily serine protease
VDAYLDLDSLELALKKGLELHEEWKAGKLPGTPRPKPDFAKNYPLLVERTIGHGACVECHLIADYQALQKEQEGKLDKIRDMYRSPDIHTIGIFLDVPKGLLVEKTEGPAAAAGMLPGDTISHVEGVRVYTFGDMQYQYDKVDRHAEETRFSVDRNGERVDLTIKLPPRFWLTNLVFRHWTIEPRPYFRSEELTADEKTKLGLPEKGFASRVIYVDGVADLLGSHQLKTGDIVAGVNGVQEDEIANTAELYIRLRTKSGESSMLDVIRDGQHMEMKLTTGRMGFRK